MHWESWPLTSFKRTRMVAGFDVGAATCELVVLMGSQTQPLSVLYAETLELPQEIMSPEGLPEPDRLGRWLSDYLQQNDCVVDAICMGLPDERVLTQTFALAAGLSDEDVAFQLPIEVQAASTTPAIEMWMDYQRCNDLPDTSNQGDADIWNYHVIAVPRGCVEDLQQRARSAQLKLIRVEGRASAQQRIEKRHIFNSLSAVSVALGLQCEVAFGLALGAWQPNALNLLPLHHRDHDVARRAWFARAFLYTGGGILLGQGVIWMSSLMWNSQQTLAHEASGVEHTLQQLHARHAQAQLMQQRAAGQAQWLSTQKRGQQQTLHWVKVLNQVPQGVWIAEVSQQDLNWRLQGEALTSAHAKLFLSQLQALDVWGNPPGLVQLQWVPTTTLKTASPVWQFRIEGWLKAPSP